MSKLLNYYKKMPLALKASIWFLFTTVLQKGLSFIVTPFYTRLLTTEEYGTYSLYQSWMSIITIFATLDLSAGVFNNALNKCNDEKQKWKTLSNFQFLEIITISIVGMIVLLINFLTGEQFGFSNKILLLMFVQILMNSAMSLWLLKERFDYKYFKPLIVSVLASVITIVFSLLFIKFGDNKSYSLIFGAVFASIFAYLGLMAFNLLKGRDFFDFKLWKYALKFNLPLLPHYLSLTILSMSDRIMIEKFCGLTETSLYTIPYNIVSLITIFFSALNSSLVPWTYQNMKAGKYTKFKPVINGCMLFVFAITAAVVMLGPELLYIMGGEAYMDAKWVIPPAACGMFFMFLYPVFANIEFYYESNIFTMIASVVAAASNIVLNYLFIPMYGYVAAAYTTLFSYFVLAVAHLFFYKIILKKHNIKKLYDLKFILVMCLISLLLVPAALLIYKNDIVRYIIIGLIVLLFIVAIIVVIRLIKKGKISLDFIKSRFVQKNKEESQFSNVKLIEDDQENTKE